MWKVKELEMTQAAIQINELTKKHFGCLLITCPSCWCILSTYDKSSQDDTIKCNWCWEKQYIGDCPDLFV